MPMPCSPEITPSSAARQLHDARHRRVRGLQHLVVVAVDRDVGVHVAVAGVHVQRDPDAAAQHLARGSRSHSSRIGANARAGEDRLQRRADLRLPRGAQRVVLQQREDGARSDARRGSARPASSQPAAPQRARPRARSASACCTRSSSSSAAGDLARRRRSCRAAGCRARRTPPARRPARACCASDSSMLMRSMPSVYSPMRGSGITTSSLILKALVCLAIAAVRLRSSQNFLRASALTATKPSPPRALAMRTTSRRGARHGVGVVADDVAEQHHLRAAPPRLAWSRSRPPSGSGRRGAPGRRACTPPGASCSANMKSLISTIDGHRVARLAEELEADGARVRRHPVQDPARA